MTVLKRKLDEDTRRYQENPKDQKQSEGEARSGDSAAEVVKPSDIPGEPGKPAETKPTETNRRPCLRIRSETKGNPER